MADFLDTLARSARATVDSGYYDVSTEMINSGASLKKAVLEAKHAAVITEIKVASPSAGTIREEIQACKIAESMEKGGAVGISVLTEPKHFNGSLLSLVEARRMVKLPILMKDIIISPVQLEAASKLGANVALLIEALFERGYCECSLSEMIAAAHSKGLEVLLEAHTEVEFLSALRTDADLVGINNRNLATLKVDLNVTNRILERNNSEGKVIVSESGVSTPADLRFLHECGAHAFLVGSAVMLADNVEAKVKEFVSAL
ncbi:indole-3-glycerol-phosphate synthase [Candidatus Bathyarchaeota archaeon]|jgi:indole-3-glycerol phosphate synthase|nr:indole-3-glycerol-phosphate synthase [Candidatus Bathyarchaeota archaeon]